MKKYLRLAGFDIPKIRYLIGKKVSEALNDLRPHEIFFNMSWSGVASNMGTHDAAIMYWKLKNVYNKVDT